MSGQEQPVSVIVWAVDPFADELELQQQAAWAIKALSNNLSFRVHPVYAVVHPLLRLPEPFSNQIFEEMQENARQEVNALTCNVDLKSITPLEILKVGENSITARVLAVVEYARKVEARVIVASTHARTAIGALFLGSFVEQLSLKSDIPLLVVNPSWNHVTGFEEIFFPTDFSEASSEVFTRVISLARTLGIRLRIFHKFNYQIIEGWSFDLGASEVYPELKEAERQEVLKKAMRWERRAQDQGVRAFADIDSTESGTVADAILKRSEDKACLIAMAARSGMLKSTLLGTNTRRVLRGTRKPLWIVHTEPKRPEDQQEEAVMHAGAGSNRDAPRNPIFPLF